MAASYVIPSLVCVDCSPEQCLPDSCTKVRVVFERKERQVTTEEPETREASGVEDKLRAPLGHASSYKLQAASCKLILHWCTLNQLWDMRVISEALGRCIEGKHTCHGQHD